MPVALLQEFDEAIISQAYPVFKVKDKNEILPEYLMMWFSRAEFDREACFYAVGGVRGSLEWEDFCEMKLPVPDIEKQREIVAEYNIVKNRIALNNQLIQKLEETAHAIYKQWFVDFEFPDENGKPYKSSGGKMVWNEELEKEIPPKWEKFKINQLCNISSSKRIFESEYCSEGIPFYRGKEITLKKAGEIVSNPIYISKQKFKNLVEKYGKPKEGDILITAVGTIGSTYMVQAEEFYFKDGNVIWLRNFKMKDLNYFIYDFMQSDKFSGLINEITIGSTQNAITIKSLGEQEIYRPDNELLNEYNKLSKCLQMEINLKKNEKKTLIILKDLLLSKMTKVETEKEVGKMI
jgi:type I restriction enzyme S subunit